MNLIPDFLRRVRQQQQKPLSPREQEIRRLNKKYLQEERRRIRFKKLKQLARLLAIELALILIIGAAVATFWGLSRLPQLTTSTRNVIIGVGILVTMVLVYLVYKSRDGSFQRRERRSAVQQPQQQIQPATPVARSEWFWWPVTALVALVLVVGVTRYLTRSTSLVAQTSRTIAVEVGREWSEPIKFPTGLQVDWMPESAVTYELITADGKITTFPAVTQAPIAVSSLLSPWFKFRAVDADSVVINVVAYVPR